MPGFLDAMLEALRTKPSANRIVYKNGEFYRSEPSPDRGILGALRDQQKQVQYGRYRKIAADSGEEPVSYAEWLGNH